MKRIICAMLVAFAISLPTKTFAADAAWVYEPSWQTIDFPSNVKLSIDANSVKKDEKTGVISFFYEKSYDDAEIYDGKIRAIAGRVDYDPAAGKYWVRSLNYLWENGPAMDAYFFYQPDWREIEKGSLEEALCSEAAKFAQK